MSLWQKHSPSRDAEPSSFFDNEPAVSEAPEVGANGLGRQFLESLICLGIAVLLFRCFALEGYIISTGSMAPNLLGYHKRIECPDCGYRFPYGVAFDREVTTSSLVRCPNCMQPAIDVSEVPRNDGDQLLVFKHAFEFRDPKRWEVVVFLNPANPLQAYVKRVVGLPGEAIQVRDGDVFINGKLERKSFEKQRAIRIPVFDQNYSALSEDWLPRWIPDSGWAQTDRSFIRSTDNDPRFAWVQYRHWPRHQTSAGESNLRSFEPLPIQDCYGYNRIYGMDEDHPVRDFTLSAKLDFPTSGQLAAVLETAQQLAVCVLDLDQKEARLYLVADDAQLDSVATQQFAPLAQIALPTGGLGKDVDFEFSNFDQTLQVALQGQVLLKLELDFPPSDSVSPARHGVSKPLVHAVQAPEADEPQTFGVPPSVKPARAEITIAGYESQAPDLPAFDEVSATKDERSPVPARANRSQVRFGATGGAFRVRQLQIFRDIHYLSEAGQHACQTPCQLGPDEFFFLGDNSPVSLDSRGWKNPTVPRRLLVGKPLCVHLPSKPVQFKFGQRETLLRLPDFEHMRWIR